MCVFLPISKPVRISPRNVFGAKQGRRRFLRGSAREPHVFDFSSPVTLTSSLGPGDRCWASAPCVSSEPSADGGSGRGALWPDARGPPSSARLLRRLPHLFPALPCSSRLRTRSLVYTPEKSHRICATPRAPTRWLRLKGCRGVLRMKALAPRGVDAGSVLWHFALCSV